MRLSNAGTWLKNRLYAHALERLETPPPCLWSKGISRHCDTKGPETYWLDATESVQSDAFFKRHFSGARGLVWVRLGSRARDGLPCDLDAFVRAALPTIDKPFALITTDGDVSVPSDLPRDTVDRLLECPFLISWHTQNHDGYAHAKLAPIPIGLDLHTPRFPTSPHRLVSRLRKIAKNRPPPDRLPLKVLCDLGVSLASEERQMAVASLRGCDHVTFLDQRISQTAIWKHYAGHPFVLSAEGNGLDCHRSWELLYLGCIVITKRSSLDPLFDDLPVVSVEDWNAVRDRANLVEWLQRYAPLTGQERIWQRLQPDNYLKPIRQALAAAQR